MIQNFVIAVLGFWGIACTLGFCFMIADKVDIVGRSSAPKMF